MKCCNCKHLGSGYMYNECKRFGFEYFHEFYDNECPYINDNYELTEDGKEIDPPWYEGE